MVRLGCMNVRAEYIWIDGQRPTAKMRSKTKIIPDPHGELDQVPEWGFDGSSTHQATTQSSDCMLQPVCLMPDPVRNGSNVLVLCEVFLPDGMPHPSNTRVRLRDAAKRSASHEPLFGVEQEYTLYDENGGRPYRWPAERTAFPAPQGPYYCGVGCDEVYGRDLIEAHTAACLRAGLAIYGTNGEVMPAQWEFQIGPLPPPAIADHLWIARWLLYRLGEEHRISAKLDPKPISGDWNGAGAHTNFSTKAMRQAPGGVAEIREACERLGKFHEAHIQDHVYGEDNHRRLTGRHETASIDTFRFDVGDRGASIRIPARVAVDDCGYLEDRRPAANMDPYRVCTAILETVCGDGFDPEVFQYFKTQ